MNTGAAMNLGTGDRSAASGQSDQSDRIEGVDSIDQAGHIDGGDQIDRDALEQARKTAEGLTYLPGFGNEHSSEAVPGALPLGRNSPQRAPLGLYAEQLSGTAFTEPRAANRRSWLYRIRPSAAHPPLRPHRQRQRCAARPSPRSVPDPNRLRWNPLPEPAARHRLPGRAVDARRQRRRDRSAPAWPCTSTPRTPP